MAFYYDVSRTSATNASGNTETTHLWVKTAANQETMAIKGCAVTAYNFGTAGSASLRIKDNAGTTASGGTAQTPRPKNLRAPAAQSVWANDALAITAGTSLTIRVAIGFAQTGGNGGWVALTPDDAIQMMPNATNPVDVEFTSIAFTGSVPFTVTPDISEGIG